MPHTAVKSTTPLIPLASVIPAAAVLTGDIDLSTKLAALIVWNFGQVTPGGGNGTLTIQTDRGDGIPDNLIIIDITFPDPGPSQTGYLDLPPATRQLHVQVAAPGASAMDADVFIQTIDSIT